MTAQPSVYAVASKMSVPWSLVCVNMFGFEVVHGAEIAIQLPERWSLQSQESLKL